MFTKGDWVAIIGAVVVGFIGAIFLAIFLSAIVLGPFAIIGYALYEIALMFKGGT